MLVFWRKGFNATTLRDLSDALGINMPSLYAAFDSKEKLYVETVDLFMGTARSMLWSAMDGLAPRAATEAVLRATARDLSSGTFHPTGCMVTSAFVDEDMPVAVAEAIRQARRDWIEMFESVIARAVNEHEKAHEIDIEGLARFYFGMIQSIGMQAHDGASAAELECLVRLAMKAWPIELCEGSAIGQA